VCADVQVSACMQERECERENFKERETLEGQDIKDKKNQKGGGGKNFHVSSLYYACLLIPVGMQRVFQYRDAHCIVSRHRGLYADLPHSSVSQHLPPTHP